MTFGRLLAVSAMALLAGGAQAETFNRIASFPVAENLPPEEDPTHETSSEIIAATQDGMTLVYTDSPLWAIGLIDISTPADPKPLGTVSMGGEPTSVGILGNTAFVAVNTSQNYAQPSGVLKAIDLATKSEIAACDLGGQPDSVAVAPDGSFIAVAIENERDEDLNGGALPQLPAGFVLLVDLSGGVPDCAEMTKVSLTGLAEAGDSDPEPEFVNINGLGETAVTLQENNHIAVIARDGTILSHFSAGAVDLEGIDATDERAALIFDEAQPDRKREPDAIKWLDDTRFAIANEGDYKGGSRGWSIFTKDGTLVSESGASLERAIVEIGHYPDKRSDAKGVEPESLEFGRFVGIPHVFVGTERASVIGVYDVTDPVHPLLMQLLPSGVAPEGIVAIPDRNLLITANEADLIDEGGARAHVMIYEYQHAPTVYPHLTSAGMAELTGWGALSGLVAGEDGLIYGVNDSFYSFQPTIFTIDTTQTPNAIVAATRVTRKGHPAQKLDMEGIARDGAGGFWVASEGRTDRVVPHALYHIDASGEIVAEIGLPPELMAVETRFGFEGITRIADRLWMAVQREWKDDPAHQVKLVAYDIATGEWGAVRYPLTVPETGWIGLSEISTHGDHVYVIERDNQNDERAVTKAVYRIPLSEMVPAPLGGDLPVVSKELERDLLPDLKATGGYVLDKVEGMAITDAGQVWIVTDNDGVDDSSGETMLFSFALAQ